MTPEQRAAKVAETMWASDHASQWLGMSLVHVGEGRATLSLDVQKHHCNGHGIGHGSITFALADSAFAFACNSRNQTTVAAQNAISYLAPVRLGDRLTAEAREVHLRGRSGIYDVTVTNQNNEKIAEFRGTSRAIGGTIFREGDEDEGSHTAEGHA